MIKKFLPFLFILLLIGCRPSTKSTEYFGQTNLDTIPVIFAPELISIEGRLEHGLSFSPDSRELAFGILNKDDFSGKIYYSKKVDDNWTEPIVFEPLKNESVYLPYFSPDGKSILYAQSRPDTNNVFTDIWILKKNNGYWIQPEKMDSPISTLTRESSACMTLDNTIYFSSNRDGNGLADLYFSPIENGEYLDAERIDSICTVRDEESIFVAPDKNYIIFSRYATNENGPDLFISYQDSKRNWTKPCLLDSTINTSNWERRPFVSIDNKFLFFTRMTFNQTGIAESDIYWVSTQKVFKPYVCNSLPDITVKVGKSFEVSIPADYFKDIDDKQLNLSINHYDLDWLEFDNKSMKLSGLPTLIGDFELIFMAVDKHFNKTENKIKITVIK
ncbi:MAG: hypothetical protein ACOWWR_10940 [Eubacteriales bacterium]